jgi:hypothetical protein
MAIATREQIAEVYVASFNRAADGDGLAYWDGSGMPKSELTDIIEIAEAMLASPEIVEMYGDPSSDGFDREAFIIKLYANLFNKTVDGTDEGVQYWVKSTDISNAKMIIALINGAKGEFGDPKDKAILENKTAVGLDFADSGLNNVEEAKAVMSGVTDDVATVETAKVKIDEIKPEDGAPVGSVITVTEPEAQVENTEIAVGTVIATITIEEGMTYTLTGDDAAKFTLEEGKIKVATAYTPDFENKESYVVTVEAKDTEGKVVVTKELSIAVTDVEPEGTTTVLTTETEPLVGTAGNDTYSAVASTLSVENTLNSKDTIDGGDGEDFLTIDLKSNFSGLGTDGSIKKIENISLTNSTSLVRSFNAKNITDVTSYSLDSAKGISLSNLKDTGITVNIKSAQKDSSIAFDSKTTLTGTTDAMTLSFDGVGAAKVLNTDGTTKTDENDVKITMASIEDLTLESKSASFIDLSGGDAVTKLTVNGDADLSISKVGTKVVELDASEMKGSLTIDTTNTGASLKSLKTGDGSDTIAIDAKDILANAAIEGGAGEDTLKLSDSAGSTLQLSMSGVETLEVTSISSGKELTFSAKNVADLANIQVDKANSGAVNFVNFGSNDVTLTTVGSLNAQDISVDSSGAATINMEAENSATAKAKTGSALTSDNSAAKVAINSAAQATINVGDYVNFTGTFEAQKATSVMLNVNSSANSASTPTEQSGFSGILTAQAATNLNIQAKGVVDLKADSALSVLESLTIDANSKVDLSNVALGKIASVNLSGSESASSITLGTLGITSTDHNVELTATGLAGGLTVSSMASKQDVAINVEAVKGNILLGTIDSVNTTVNASGLTGTLKVGAITSLTGSVTLNAEGNLKEITTGIITGKSVTVNFKDSLKDVTIGDATNDTADVIVTDSFTYTAGLKAANSGATHGIEIATAETATNTTFTLNGGIGDDVFAIQANKTAENATLTVKGNLDIGKDQGIVSASNSSGASITDKAVTIDASGLTGSEITTLIGSKHNDTITGSAGVDYIGGMGGADKLTGGEGADIFIFRDRDTGITVNAADTISDFKTTEDKLLLSFDFDKNAAALKSGDTDKWVVTDANYKEADTGVENFDAAKTNADTLLDGTVKVVFEHDATNGYLFFDRDTDGTADEVIILTGIDNSEIVSADILIAP